MPLASGRTSRDLAVHEDAASGDESLDGGTRKAQHGAEVPLDGLIEPAAGIAAVGRERRAAGAVSRDRR
jgi:hypothetical protein